MEIKLNIKKKVFNDIYFPYLRDYSHKYEVYYGGSGSGKSYFIAQKLLIKALTDKRDVLVIRKVGVSQKESCWKLIKNLLSEWKIYEYCQVNVSEMKITLPNGSIFLFKGLDDPERIKSIVDISDVWCEECTELNLEDFEQLTLRVRPKGDNPQFFCSFNPVSKVNWVYKRWFADGVEIPENTFILQTTYKDNKFLQQDYIDELENKINTNPTYYKIYALGQFCSLDKLVYNNWRISTENPIPYAPIIAGLDFGFTNDPTAFVVSNIDEKNKIIYIFKNWVETNRTNPQVAEAIKRLGFSKSVIIADSAEPKSVAELRKLGLYRIKESVKGPDSIINGIQKLQQYQILVSPECEEIITELENYSWTKDKQTGEYTNKPIDDFNHSLDALRYSLQSLNTQLKTMSKTVLGI